MLHRSIRGAVCVWGESGKIDASGQKHPVIAKPVRKLAVAIRIPYAQHKNVLPTQRETDSHVASLLGMTVVFFTLICLLPNGNTPKLATPQSANADSSPRRGAKPHQKIGTAHIRRPDSHIHVFLYRIYPHLQLMCIFPLPRGTRSIVPQPGHLKNL